MKCPYCGYENDEGAVNCEMCEMPLLRLSREQPQTRQAVPQTSKAERPIRRYQPEDSFGLPSVGCPTAEHL